MSHDPVGFKRLRPDERGWRFCRRLRSPVTIANAPIMQAGSIPCPPSNPIFVQGATTPSMINTWLQSFWDYWGWGYCVNDIPLNFIMSSSIPNQAPATGVTNIAMNGAGTVLAVAYSTGNNQIAGIEIYQLNCNTWNLTQTIVPEPSSVQCNANTCTAFTIAMAFSDDGSIFALGMPTLGPCGTGMIFTICGCDYCLVAEIQPASQMGQGGASGLSGSAFGYAVAVAGNGCRVAFGIPACSGQCTANCPPGSGSVATFTPSVNCTWTQESLIFLSAPGSFMSFLVNGNLSCANPIGNFAYNPSSELQPSFGRSLAFHQFGNNLIIGGNNAAFVYGNINTNLAAPGAANSGGGNTCGLNTGPFQLIATLQGIGYVSPKQIRSGNPGRD